MKSLLLIIAVLLIAAFSAQAAATEQEKAFVEKYKTALEANDTTALQSCLYTTGADPMIVGFYKMMQSSGSGRQSFQDRAGGPDARGRQKSGGTAGFSGGGKVCLNRKPTKKLVIVIEKKDENGSSTNTTENLSSRCQAPVSNAIN